MAVNRSSLDQFAKYLDQQQKHSLFYLLEMSSFQHGELLQPFEVLTIDLEETCQQHPWLAEVHLVGKHIIPDDTLTSA
jgi:hypothetical protein